MSPDEARRILGVGSGAGPGEVRARHRALIRRAHPDAGGDARRAADLNAALAVLEDASPSAASSASAAPPPAAPVEPWASPVPGADRVLRLDIAPRELLLRLAEAGHEIGEVVFVDPHAGLLEIVVGEGSSTAQLAVTVGTPGTDGVPVAFTLDSLGAPGAAPSIATVVEDLVAAARGGLC